MEKTSAWGMIRLGDYINFNPKKNLSKGFHTKKVAMEKLQPFSKFINDFEIEIMEVQNSEMVILFWQQ